MSCAICNKAITDAEAFFKLDCNMHLAHISHRTLDCALCTPVQGKVAPVAGKAANTTATKEISDEAAIRKAIASERAREPLSPPNPGFLGKMLGGVRKAVTLVSESSKPDWESNDPFKLLRARVPLRDLVNVHGYDITELINDHGVTINDFFENGYKLGDMCDAFSSRMNRKEGLDVLYFLRIDAEHFRQCPDMVQVPVIKQKLGYVGAALRNYGFAFRPGPDMWTLPEMLEAGMTFSDAVAAGMTRKSDWARVRVTGTPQQVAMFRPEESVLVDDTALVNSPSAIYVSEPATQTRMPTSSLSSSVVYPASASLLPVSSTVHAVRVQGPTAPGVALTPEQELALKPVRAPYNGPRLVERKPKIPIVVVTRK